MLCNLEENGKEKCVKYWENGIGGVGISTPILSNFDLKYTDEIINEDITIRNINILNKETKKEKKNKTNSLWKLA